MPSMIVSDAGTSAANGTYIESGTLDGKPYYVLSSPFPSIYWDGFLGVWRLFGPEGVIWYRSFEDVATPNLVSSWDVIDGDSPAPTVTAEASGPVMPIFVHHYAQQGMR